MHALKTVEPYLVVVLNSRPVTASSPPAFPVQYDEILRRLGYSLPSYSQASVQKKKKNMQ